MMPALRPIACALLLPLLAACEDANVRAEREAVARTVVRPPAGEEVFFRRVPDNSLWIEEPGVLVIRDERAWRTLWERYASHGPRVAPPLDFSRWMVAAVSMGGRSSCSASASYVGRVERDRDSMFVVIGHDAYPRPGGEMTCMEYVAPVDLLMLPRWDVPVAFVGLTQHVRVPGPAAWLARDTAAPSVLR